MNNDVLNGLNPEFLKKVQELLAKCEAEDVIMKPFFGCRSPWNQAKLWRQSRSYAEVMQGIEFLKFHKAPFLADCIKSVGKQFGLWATNAMPGFSWHQFGEAVDCYWLLGRTAIWTADDSNGGRNGYRVYAQIAENMKLTSLGRIIGDWVHVQYQTFGVLRIYGSYAEVDRRMKALWEGRNDSE